MGISSPAEATASGEAPGCGVAGGFEVSDGARWQERDACLKVTALWWGPALLEQGACDFASLGFPTLTHRPHTHMTSKPSFHAGLL